MPGNHNRYLVAFRKSSFYSRAEYDVTLFSNDPMKVISFDRVPFP